MSQQPKGNKTYKSLFQSKVTSLLHAFNTDSVGQFRDSSENKIFHAEEYGSFREHACKDFLRCLTPGYLELGSGFLMTSNDSISKQCDIVIYHKDYTPFIESKERQRFYPIETVVAIGEIKSDLSKKDLETALIKLAGNKNLRREISSESLRTNMGDTSCADPKSNVTDHIFSFLICNKFKFDPCNITEVLHNTYPLSIADCDRHNIILSLKDGLAVYIAPDNIFMNHIYPVFNDKLLPSKFIKNEQGDLRGFASSFNIGVSLGKTFYPEMIDYLEPLP